MKLKKIIRLAKDASEMSNHPRVKIGAIIFNGSDILGVGFNQLKSHPKQKKYNRCRPYNIEHDYLHAEMTALIRADYDSLGATLLVYRNDKNGHLANCRPCEACQKAIIHYGIKRVIYIEDGRFYDEKMDTGRHTLLPQQYY